MAKGQYDYLFEEREETPQDAVARPQSNPAGALDAALDFGVNTLGETGLTALAGLATGGLGLAGGLAMKSKSAKHFLNLPEGIERTRAIAALKEAQSAHAATMRNLKTIEANAKALSSKKAPAILTNAKREAAATEEALKIARGDLQSANQMFQLARTTGGSLMHTAANAAPYAGLALGVPAAAITQGALRNRDRISLDEVPE